MLNAFLIVFGTSYAYVAGQIFNYMYCIFHVMIVIIWIGQ